MPLMKVFVWIILWKIFWNNYSTSWSACMHVYQGSLIISLTFCSLLHEMSGLLYSTNFAFTFSIIGYRKSPKSIIWQNFWYIIYPWSKSRSLNPITIIQRNIYVWGDIYPSIHRAFIVFIDHYISLYTSYRTMHVTDAYN